MVHDIGGPIGLEVAAADPHRVRSLTILNTTIAVESFHRPWVMNLSRIHSWVKHGRAWVFLRKAAGYVASYLMRALGVTRRVPTAEIACYV